MKVIMIGSDRKLFEEGSAVLGRTIEYGKRMEELHIIVFSRKNLGLKNKTVSSNIFLYPTGSISPFSYPIDAVRIGKMIIRKRRLNRQDTIVSCQDPSESGLVGWRLSRIFGLPLFLQIHTDIFSGDFGKSFLNLIRRRIASFLIPRADGIRVVSRRISDSISKRFNLAVMPFVLPVFVDVSAISASPITFDLKQKYPDFQPVLLMVCRLSREKRVDLGIDVLRKVKETYPSAGLVISGSGPEENRLKDYVASRDLVHSVAFVGWRDDVVSLYKTADLLLITSEYEGYGMVIVEALAAGLPVASFDVGIASEMKEEGLDISVCPVGDIASLSAAAISRIGRNMGGLPQVPLRGTMKEGSMTVGEYADRYVKVLQEVLDRASFR